MELIPLVIYTVAIFAGLAALFMIGSFIVFKIKEPKVEESPKQSEEQKREETKTETKSETKETPQVKQPDQTQSRVKTSKDAGSYHKVKPPVKKAQQDNVRTVRITAIREQKKNLDARTTKSKKIHQHLVPSKKDRFRVLNNKQQSAIRNDPKRRTTRPFYHPDTGVLEKGEDQVKNAIDSYSNEKEELKAMDLNKKRKK
jgi:hypothetical protein